MVQLGKQLKIAREAAGLTQEELGTKVGVTGVTIMRYERGVRQPRLEQLRKIADALNVDWLTLVDDKTAANMIISDVRDALESTKTPLERVNIAMKQMDKDGQNKVAVYAEDILPRYQKELETPSQAPPHKKGDTTPEE